MGFLVPKPASVTKSDEGVEIGSGTSNASSAKTATRGPEGWSRSNTAIEAMLVERTAAPRKQRIAARRILSRLTDERGAEELS